MNTIRKTILAAAAVAATFGAMAVTTTADAGWKIKYGYGPTFGYVYHQPSCWLPVWNGYRWINKKFYGSACYSANYTPYTPYTY